MIPTLLVEKTIHSPIEWSEHPTQKKGILGRSQFYSVDLYVLSKCQPHTVLIIVALLRV